MAEGGHALSYRKHSLTIVASGHDMEWLQSHGIAAMSWNRDSLMLGVNQKLRRLTLYCINNVYMQTRHIGENM